MSDSTRKRSKVVRATVDDTEWATFKEISGQGNYRDASKVLGILIRKYNEGSISI